MPDTLPSSWRVMPGLGCLKPQHRVVCLEHWVLQQQKSGPGLRRKAYLAWICQSASIPCVHQQQALQPHLRYCLQTLLPGDLGSIVTMAGAANASSPLLCWATPCPQHPTAPCTLQHDAFEQYTATGCRQVHPRSQGIATLGTANLTFPHVWVLSKPAVIPQLLRLTPILLRTQAVRRLWAAAPPQPGHSHAGHHLRQLPLPRARPCRVAPAALPHRGGLESGHPLCHPRAADCHCEPRPLEQDK